MDMMRRFVLMTILCLGGPLFADTTADPATCAITVTVDGLLEWEGNFTAIAAADMSAHITNQNSVVTGSSTQTLFTNGNVILTADNTVASELDTGSDTDQLVTEYSLAYDGDGAAATGGSAVAYTLYDNFLKAGAHSHCTHVSTDGAVEVTLGVRASNDTHNVADAGDYTATQTLTATWNP
jgi:hypothetical protein